MTVVLQLETPPEAPDPRAVSYSPIVSVLVRTQGRASLQVAVESVRQQIFQDWQLLIVNAAGNVLPVLETIQTPQTPKDFAEIRILNPGKKLSRSEAANALLEAAGGKYAIFLDDDDWLLPDHLSKLVDCLQNDRQLTAAYSDVQSILAVRDGAQEVPGPLPEKACVRGHVYAQDFDLLALQLHNYLPIHSVLFRLDRVGILPACRFAQELTLFEDWDFWLQLVRRGRFKRVPGASAIYALSSEAGSGHAELHNPERVRMLTLLGARQLERWQASDVAALVEHEASRIQAQTAQQQIVDMLKGQLAGAVQSRDELRLYADETVHHLRHSQQEEQLLRQEQAHLIQLNASEREALMVAIAHLQSEGSDLQQGLMALRTHSQVQQAEINTLAQLRLQHLDHIAAMQKSRSWQLTRPLRYAGRLARRLSGLASLRFARNALRAVRQDIAQKGLVGFVQRLPYYLKHQRTYLALLSRKVPDYSGSAFAATPARLHNLRLHPDLTGGGPLIDAKVSVVIPTLNAGTEFHWMLRKLRAQCGVREIEIVVVDSGSRDATVQMARDAGAVVVEILPSEFSHSYARNLGADHATGDYVLFTVQDAYPIGNYWMQGMLAFLQEHASESLAAVSCAEYSRADSDMMYDSMIHTHYTFLGCRENDRIGQFLSNDHMALRSQGQLSDLSCLIERSCFQQFRYQGSYAEDLDLGVRMIQSGKKVALLASIKVIHSHNRPAYYYLKRSFVDVIFLVGLFDDFTYPPVVSLAGLVVGIQATAQVVSGWLKGHVPEPANSQKTHMTLDGQIDYWLAASRKTLSAPHVLMLQTAADGQALALGDQRLDDFVASLPAHHFEGQTISALATGLSGAGRDEARNFADMFIARLEHFKRFVAPVYGFQDALLARELADVVRKTFAASAGSALAFYCLGHPCDGMAVDENIIENADQRAARKLYALATGI